MSCRAVTPPPDTDAVPIVPVPAIEGEPACCEGLHPGRVAGTATFGCCAALGLLDGVVTAAGGATALGLLEGARTVGLLTPPPDWDEVPGAEVVAPDDDPVPPEFDPPDEPPVWQRRGPLRRKGVLRTARR